MSDLGSVHYSLILKKKLCNKVPCHKTPFWIEDMFSLQFKLKGLYMYVIEL